jgi:hypothetical protein
VSDAIVKVEKVDADKLHEDKVALANCVIFALRSMRNKPMYDGQKKAMTSWHDWFRQTLRDTGFGEFADMPDLPAPTITTS